MPPYTHLCTALSTSPKPNDSDLGFLEVVDEDSGLAIYNLTRFRLREIKSSDPLVRAIKLQMGIQHINYVPTQSHNISLGSRITDQNLPPCRIPKSSVTGRSQPNPSEIYQTYTRNSNPSPNCLASNEKSSTPKLPSKTVTMYSPAQTSTTTSEVTYMQNIRPKTNANSRQT